MKKYLRKLAFALLALLTLFPLLAATPTIGAAEPPLTHNFWCGKCKQDVTGNFVSYVYYSSSEHQPMYQCPTCSYCRSEPSLKNPIPAERRPARKRLFVSSVAMNTEIRWITTGHFQPTTIKPMCAPADATAAAILRRCPAHWTVPTASGARSAAAARPSMVRSTQAITIGGAGRATAI